MEVDSSNALANPIPFVNVMEVDSPNELNSIEANPFEFVDHEEIIGFDGNPITMETEHNVMMENEMPMETEHNEATEPENNIRSSSTSVQNDMENMSSPIDHERMSPSEMRLHRMRQKRFILYFIGFSSILFHIGLAPNLIDVTMERSLLPHNYRIIMSVPLSVI